MNSLMEISAPWNAHCMYYIQFGVGIGVKLLYTAKQKGRIS